MSLEKSIQSIVSKLDQLSTRLENIEGKLGQGGSSVSTSSSSGGDVSGKVQEYLDSVVTPNVPGLLEHAQKIGGKTNEATVIFSKLLAEHEKLLSIASQSKKPSDNDFQTKILLPIFTVIQELNAFAADTRGTDHFLFASSLAEGSGALLWSQHNLPVPYIKELIGASQFHSNKILREFKGVDDTKVGFVTSLNGYLKSLEDFVKKVHTTGLTWNPNGGDALSLLSSVTVSAPPSGGPSGAPPGPPPAPKLEPSTSTSTSSTSDRDSLLNALNQGEGITGRLKKVTDDMKAKNRKDRTGVVVAKSTAKKTQQKLPPKFALEGNKWVLDYITEQINVDITETKQSVSLYRTEGAMIRINGKFNGIVIDSCKKTTIVLDEAISSCQLINCSDMKIQILVSIPSIAIDKTSGCHVYLSEKAIETQVITSKSDECNVLVEKGQDWEEFPVPEQFISIVVNGKLKTESVAHIGD